MNVLWIKSIVRWDLRIAEPISISHTEMISNHGRNVYVEGEDVMVGYEYSWLISSHLVANYD